MSGLSEKQIKLIEHTIGLTEDRIKRKKYEYYRNYFCAGKNEMLEFEDLISKKLATKNIRHEQVYYYITEEGIQIIADINKITIVEID